MFSPPSDWKNNLYSNVTCMKAEDRDYLRKDTILSASSKIWGILTLFIDCVLSTERKNHCRLCILLHFQVDTMGELRSVGQKTFKKAGEDRCSTSAPRQGGGKGGVRSRMFLFGVFCCFFRS